MLNILYEVGSITFQFLSYEEIRKCDVVSYKGWITKIFLLFFLMYRKNLVCWSHTKKIEATLKEKTWNEVIRSDLKERIVSKDITRDRNDKGLKGIWNSTPLPLKDM